MAQLVSVVRFDDGERDVLGGSKVNRENAATTLGKELTTQIKAVFKEARDLADTNPSAPQLQSLSDRLSALEATINVLGVSDSRDSVGTAIKQIRDVVDSASSALPH